MKLGADEPILGGRYKEEFRSPFPSQAALLNEKYLTIRKNLEGNPLTQGLAVIEQGKAFSAALGICNAEKAVHFGDLLTDMLPKTAWMKQGIGGGVVQGLFATVPWDGSTDPERLMENMYAAGLTVAMTVLAAIPVYGQIAAALVAVAGKLLTLLGSKDDEPSVRLILPWENYAKESDEAIVTACRMIFRTGDWTQVFMPPFEAGYSWGRNVVEGKGAVFAPVAGKAIAHGPGFGCMPGTFKVAGHVQVMPPSVPTGKLLRHAADMNGNSSELPYRFLLTATGDFYPATAQLGAATWQQCMAGGNPDMYKLDTFALEKAWRMFFENLYDSASGIVKGAHLDPSSGSPAVLEIEAVAAQAVEPYLCWRLRNDPTWNLGLPEGYRPSPFFHEAFWKEGPVRVAERNPCQWVEEDKRDNKKLWPYVFKAKNYPGEHPSLRPVTKGYWRPTKPVALPGGKVPPGYRCVPYPTGELATASYASPFTVFILPQLLALRARQSRCLTQTLVCAYVRPVALSKDRPAHAAFAKDPELAKRCSDARALLLKSPARFLVNLADVDDIDPGFAALLRAAGVTNSFGQKQTAHAQLKKLAGLVEGDDQPLDPPPTPGGGVAFGGPVGEPSEPSSSGGVLALAAVAAGLGLAAFHRAA